MVYGLEQTNSRFCQKLPWNSFIWGLPQLQAKLIDPETNKETTCVLDFNESGRISEEEDHFKVKDATFLEKEDKVQY